MTQSAMEFVTALTFQALSGHSVHSKLLDSEEENAMGHINLARWADEIVVAPASANSIAKFAHGIADDLLSTVILATQCKVTLAPSMNQAMWLNPVVQDVHNLLRDYHNKPWVRIGDYILEYECSAPNAIPLLQVEHDDYRNITYIERKKLKLNIQ